MMAEARSDGIGQVDWDEATLALNGHLLQSWRWGEFKASHGWEVERLLVQSGQGVSALAQVLFRRRGPVSVGYIPRGPAVAGGSSQITSTLLERIDAACRSRRALYAVIEQNVDPLPGWTPEQPPFAPGPEHIQPVRTVKIPLLADEELLGQMHQKTRYSVRLAERRGVTLVRAAADDTEAVNAFYGLLQETSSRNEFGIHSRDYYADFLRVFGDDSLLLLARNEGHVAAGLIAAHFGREAIYMYGASSTKHRAHGAAFALQFEAMRWARGRGAEVYDLWGIPKTDPESLADGADGAAGTKGDDWRGLYRFKTGFGGHIISYPPTIERRYRSNLTAISKKLVSSRG